MPVIVSFLDDSKDCYVHYFVVTDITLFSYLVYRPPMMPSTDENISVKHADQYYHKLNIFYQYTKKLNKQSIYISRYIYGACGCKQNLIKAVVSYRLFPLNYCT